MRESKTESSGWKVLSVFIETMSDMNISKAQMRAGSEGQVLVELLLLYDREKNHVLKSQLKKYIIRWYKIYAVIQIEIGQGHKAIKIAYKAMVFGGTVKSFFPILILGMLPNKLSRILFLKLR